MVQRVERTRGVLVVTGAHRPADAPALAALLREAPARGATFRIVGNGEWLGAGHPVAATSERIELGAFAGIEQFRPDDLTITVGAATSLDALDRATAEHGLWCPLLPWGSNRGTVGATLATASDGPSSLFLGRPRDLVLGLEAVDGTGAHLRAGGRVVKNVAGFDLTRLLTGSWGTLGVITRAHLRLRARPQVDRTLALRTTSGAEEAELHGWMRGPFAPIAAVALSSPASLELPVAVGTTHLVRIGGNSAFVEASSAALASITPVESHGAGIWDVMRERLPQPDRALHWRDSVLGERLRDRFDPHRLLNPGILGVR